MDRDLVCGLVIVVGVAVGVGGFVLWLVSIFLKAAFATSPAKSTDSMNAARAIIRQHAETLRVKRLQIRTRDDYGNFVNGKWSKEIVYFYDNVLTPALKSSYGMTLTNLSGTKYLFEITGVPRRLIFSVVDEELDAYERNRPILSEDVSGLSPTAFEVYCAQLLANSGWQANTTKASGDQGIDILATRNGQKAVFQCKKQSSPVGNKAVQEVIAGQSFASADYAFVVSNADFTPSARELAAKCGVYLSRYQEVPVPFRLRPRPGPAPPSWR